MPGSPPPGPPDTARPDDGGQRFGVRATAAALGITHPALIKAVKEGRVTKGADGKFDVEQARRELDANSHPKMRPKDRRPVATRPAAPIAIGTKVSLIGNHPHAGKHGEVVRIEIVGALPEKGPQPVIRCEDGDECFAFPGDYAVAVPAFAGVSDGGGEENHGDPNSLAEATRQLEWEKLRKARIANDEKLHQLVPLTEVNAHVASMILRSREILTRMPGKLRDRIAQTTDPVTCEELIRTEVDLALSELSEFRP